MQIAQDDQNKQIRPVYSDICTFTNSAADGAPRRAVDILAPLFGPLEKERRDWTPVFFNGSWGPKSEERESCDQANRDIEVGALRVRKTKIPLASVPSWRERCIPNHPWHMMGCHSRESEFHQLLKYSCWKWLRDLGIQEIDFEAACQYGLADIALDGVTVECGSMPPKRLAGIGNGLDAMVLVPFGGNLEDSTLDGYLFYLGEGWSRIGGLLRHIPLPAIQLEGGAS